ncbi:hypothetical protein HYX18_00660 [Candidatus Woesearchaeota archaeon]|nr:hypothetical protein [Candidatus Woesearchaeota archaeon]
MLEIILKELEKIKEIKAKKEFLEKLIRQYSDKKLQQKLKELIKEIEKFGKERKEGQKTEQEDAAQNASQLNQLNSNLKNIVASAAPAASKQIEIEEAPKYEPRDRATTTERRTPQREGFSRLETLANELSAGMQDRNENISEYLARPEDLRRDHATAAGRIYRTQEELRQVTQQVNLRELSKKQDYINPIRQQFSPEYSPEVNPENDELKKWTSNPDFEQKIFEQIDHNYSHDIVENLKKQKKKLEDKYL